MEVFDGPMVVLGGAELEVLGRQVAGAIRSGYTVRGKPPPRELLDFAIAVNRLVSGTCGTGHGDIGAVQETATEPRNTRRAPDAGGSGQPARTLTVKEAAQATKVSESYVRRLVRRGALEVRDSHGPIAIYADSLAAWQERRRRVVNDRKAA